MRPWVVLDRDGVINEYNGDPIATLADWRPIPGSLEAIASLSRTGYGIAVISNQGMVGKGLVPMAAVEAIHELMCQQVLKLGGRINGVFFCPHIDAAGCPCRIPRVGMLDRIEEELGADLRNAPMVGDSLKDLQAARAKGCRPVLVRTGNGTQTETTTLLWPKYGVNVQIFDDLAGFARSLTYRR
jgi:D-glycero-D-manno-heptose 1,7-bisphosphate phosphatase